MFFYIFSNSVPPGPSVLSLLSVCTMGDHCTVGVSCHKAYPWMCGASLWGSMQSVTTAAAGAVYLFIPSLPNTMLECTAIYFRVTDTTACPVWCEVLWCAIWHGGCCHTSASVDVLSASGLADQVVLVKPRAILCHFHWLSGVLGPNVDHFRDWVSIWGNKNREGGKVGRREGPEIADSKKREGEIEGTRVKRGIRMSAFCIAQGIFLKQPMLYSQNVKYNLKSTGI